MSRICALGSALGLCVYRQTVAGLDAHKREKVRRKAGEPRADSAVSDSRAPNESPSKPMGLKKTHILLSRTVNTHTS